MRFLSISILAIAFALSACSAPKRKEADPGAAASPNPAASQVPASPDLGAAEQTGNSSGALELKCGLNSDERILIIVPKEQGCELHYHKFGKSSVPASSAVGQRHCEAVRNRIKANLEAAGFRCG